MPPPPRRATPTVTLIGLAIAAGTGWLIASALSWMAWMAVLSVLFIIAGDAFLGLRDVAYISRVRAFKASKPQQALCGACRCVGRSR
jgi:hypothetical protein